MHKIKYPSTEASASNPKVKLENPEVEIPEEKKLYDLRGEKIQNTCFLL
jgi:hypothetical protein